MVEQLARAWWRAVGGEAPAYCMLYTVPFYIFTEGHVGEAQEPTSRHHARIAQAACHAKVNANLRGLEQACASGLIARSGTRLIVDLKM